MLGTFKAAPNNPVQRTANQRASDRELGRSAVACAAADGER